MKYLNRFHHVLVDIQNKRIQTDYLLFMESSKLAKLLHLGQHIKCHVHVFPPLTAWD